MHRATHNTAASLRISTMNSARPRVVVAAFAALACLRSQAIVPMDAAQTFAAVRTNGRSALSAGHP